MKKLLKEYLPFLALLLVEKIIDENEITDWNRVFSRTQGHKSYDMVSDWASWYIDPVHIDEWSKCYVNVIDFTN